MTAVPCRELKQACNRRKVTKVIRRELSVVSCQLPVPSSQSIERWNRTCPLFKHESGTISNFRQVTTGNWELGTGNWELGTGNWELTTDTALAADELLEAGAVADEKGGAVELGDFFLAE